MSKTILIVPNAFKGSISAGKFCSITSKPLEELGFSPVCLPMCDGGDGTADILASYLHASPVPIHTVDALGRPKTATCYVTGDTALFDLAEICGIKDLDRKEYNVMATHTRGIGILLLHLKRQGIRNVILGVGGSASIDGGTGALAEMGMKATGSGEGKGNPVIGLQSLDTGQLKENFKDMHIDVLCDVSTPLCGQDGAVWIFGPQKGAGPDEMDFLEKQMEGYAALLEQISGKDVSRLPRGGAAGGIAAAFSALLDARLLSGAEYCLEISGFFSRLASASAVLTGEGRLDAQSMKGKLAGTLAGICRKEDKPLYAIVGRSDTATGFRKIYSLVSIAGSTRESFRHTEFYLQLAARKLGEELLLDERQ